MKIFIAAFLIAAIAAIHIENETVIKRHGGAIKKNANLDINIEAVKTAKVEQIRRHPVRYGYIRRHRDSKSESCSETKSESESRDYKYNKHAQKKDYRRFPQPEIKKVEATKTVKVGDAQ